MDMFDTRVLMETLRITPPVNTFILDTFFSQRKQFHPTNAIEIDVVVGKRVLAPYVRACDEHKTVDRAGAETRLVKTPYIKLKRNINACCELMKRQPGESIYSARTPQQRAAEMLANDLVDLRNMIIRREEWQAAQALLTGESKIMGDDYSDIVNFRMPAANIVTLAGADLWSAGTAKPLTKLRELRALASKSSGFAPGVVVGGTAAIEAFMANAEVRETIKSDSGLGGGSLNVSNAPVNGAVYYGRAAGFDIWQYNEYFYDPEADIDGEIIPTDRILLGSRGTRAERHYGVIQDLAAGNPEVDYFSKTWEVQDPSVRFLGVQSAPLAIPFQPDAFVSVKVV